MDGTGFIERKEVIFWTLLLIFSEHIVSTRKLVK
jgi:hypothetical protein